MSLEDTIRQRLHQTLDATDFPDLGAKQGGKVRESYARGEQRVIITTDRLSAFDRIICSLPFKGQVLNQLSAWWFTQTHKEVPNHMLSTPDPQAMLCMTCAPLPIEFVVRGYITGVTSTSLWKHYEQGSRTFCGYTLPEGLRKNEALPKAIVTPSTKAQDGAHDISVSREEIVKLTSVPAAVYEQAEQYSLSLFRSGQERCAAQGLILVDTKYEFGLDTSGCLRLIDEVHTPDSSRFWISSSYHERLSKNQEPESLDKEYVRRWLAERGYTGQGEPPRIPDDVKVEAAVRYIRAFERIINQPFLPALDPPISRLQKNLAAIR